MSARLYGIMAFLFFGQAYALSGSLVPDAIEERLTPVGVVEIDGDVSAKKKNKKELTPEKIYDTFLHELFVASLKQLFSTKRQISHCFVCLTSPHFTSPHFTPPHLTSSHLTSPHVTLPHLTSLWLI